MCFELQASQAACIYGLCRGPAACPPVCPLGSSASRSLQEWGPPAAPPSPCRHLCGEGAPACLPLCASQPTPMRACLPRGMTGASLRCGRWQGGCLRASPGVPVQVGRFGFRASACSRASPAPALFLPGFPERTFLSQGHTFPVCTAICLIVIVVP